MTLLSKPKLSSYNMAALFNFYKDDDGFTFFNILKRLNLNIENFSDKAVFDEYLFQPGDTFTKVSYEYYGTVELWWLICTVNKIENPFNKLVAGERIYLLKSQYVNNVLDSINNPDA